jgi:hypothetical protein
MRKGKRIKKKKRKKEKKKKKGEKWNNKTIVFPLPASGSPI